MQTFYLYRTDLDPAPAISLSCSLSRTLERMISENIDRFFCYSQFCKIFFTRISSNSSSCCFIQCSLALAFCIFFFFYYSWSQKYNRGFALLFFLCFCRFLFFTRVSYIAMFLSLNSHSNILYFHSRKLTIV